MEKEIFNKYTPTRSVLTEKCDKKLAAENFFMQFFDDFEFGASKDSYYKDWVFWLKNDKPFMGFNPKNRNLYVDYDLIWQKLNVEFGMEYDEIQEFIRHQVLHNLNIEHITPTKQGLSGIPRCYIV